MSSRYMYPLGEMAEVQVWGSWAAMPYWSLFSKGGYHEGK